MDVCALAKAAIVEGKNIHSQLVQDLQPRQCAGERAGIAVQQEQGVRRWLIGGDPPAVQLQNTGLGRVELDLVILQVDGGRSGGNGQGRLEDKLPLTLPKEQAEGDVHTEQ